MKISEFYPCFYSVNLKAFNPFQLDFYISLIFFLTYVPRLQRHDYVDDYHVSSGSIYSCRFIWFVLDTNVYILDTNVYILISTQDELWKTTPSPFLFLRPGKISHLLGLVAAFVDLRTLNLLLPEPLFLYITKY